MDCEEKLRLLKEYDHAVVDASKSEQKLNEMAKVIAGDEFKIMLEEKTRADGRLRRARSAYELHVTRHRCGDAVGAGPVRSAD